MILFIQPYIHPIRIYRAPSEHLVIIQGPIVELAAWSSGLSDFCFHESQCPSHCHPSPGHRLPQPTPLQTYLVSLPLFLVPCDLSFSRLEGSLKKKKRSDVIIPLLKDFKWLLIRLGIKFKPLDLTRPHLFPSLHSHVSPPLSSTLDFVLIFSSGSLHLSFLLLGMSSPQLIGCFSLPYPL